MLVISDIYLLDTFAALHRNSMDNPIGFKVDQFNAWGKTCFIDSR